MFSSRIASRLCIAAAMLVSATALGAPAVASERVYFATTAEPRLPSCDSVSVQSAVAGHIASADTLYYGGRTITAIDRIAEVAYKADGISPVARRYCAGVATLTDGSRHSLHYALVEYGSFTGLTWGVDACLDDLDRWRVHDGICRTVRP